jgi:hypothetical protein
VKAPRDDCCCPSEIVRVCYVVGVANVFIHVAVSRFNCVSSMITSQRSAMRLPRHVLADLVPRKFS